MEKPVKITSFIQLFNILDNSENVREFFIELAGGARSWKRLTNIDKQDRHGFYKIEVYNEIDDSKQVLCRRNLMSAQYNSIYSAIRCGSFYLYDNNENHDKWDVQFYEYK